MEAKGDAIEAPGEGYPVGDIKVFRIDGDPVSGLPGQSMPAARHLQTLVEYDANALMPAAADTRGGGNDATS